MLASNYWKSVRNLPNIIRHVQPMFRGVELNNSNVLSIIDKHANTWHPSVTYVRHQTDLISGCITSLLSNNPKIKENKLSNLTVDTLCKINSDMQWSANCEQADITSLVNKYKLDASEWFICLTTKNNNTDLSKLITNKCLLLQASDILHKHDYHMLHQNFKSNTLNMFDYNKHYSPSLLYKFGQYVTIKIIKKKHDDDYYDDIQLSATCIVISM